MEHWNTGYKSSFQLEIVYIYHYVQYIFCFVNQFLSWVNSLWVMLISFSWCTRCFALSIADDEETVIGDPFTFEDLFSPDFQPRHFTAQWIGGIWEKNVPNYLKEKKVNTSIKTLILWPNTNNFTQSNLSPPSLICITMYFRL